MAFNYLHLDANENAFFERQLEAVKARTYDVKYPALKARTLIPVDNSVPSGAETVKYNTYDSVGMAKITASYSDDLPRADVFAKENRQAIKSLGSSFGYNVQEIRAAQFGGLDLEQRKANAARKAIEEKIEKIAATGDSANGLQGLLNVTNALSYTIPNGAGGTATWGGATPKTGLEILDDMTQIANKIVDSTNGVEMPDTLLVPTAQYGIIATKPLQNNSDVTILKHFLANNPYIKAVEPWWKLKGAGASGKDRMVCYRRDPDALQLVMPQEFEQFAPEPRGLEFIVSCHARTGGVVVYYPLSICYGDGI